MVNEDAALLNRRVTHMTPAALFSRRLHGAISQATMLDLFRAGEVIAPGRTNEEEINLLATQKPPTSPVTVKPPVATSKTETPQPIT